jgi:hypothetical protein
MFQGTANERRKALNSFHSAIDMDCFNQNPGTLRWGNSYIRSYVTESSVEPDKDRPDRTINKVKFYCPVPFWYTEQTISIAPVSDHTALDTDKAYIDTEGENFGYGYPYSYKVELAAPHMGINHYAPSDFRMIIYGPAVNPTINIAGNQYKVNYSVEDGQVLIIDSRSTQPWDRRVYLVAGQTVITVFDYRDPAGSILKKIPPGDIAIAYARTYGIELTVYTTEPGIQVYTGNFLDGTVTGKKGIVYNQRVGICLETQKYPDTPNKPEWPSAVLRPGEKYTSHCTFKFGVRE